MALTTEQLRERAEIIVAAIANSTAKERDRPATVGLCENYNDLLRAVLQQRPELAGDLPKPVTFSVDARKYKTAEARYLDLQIYCEQVMALL